MNKIENIRNKTAKDSKEKGTGITLGRSTTRSLLISSPPKVTATRVALRTVRAGPLSDKKVDGTPPARSTTTIRRKPLPPSATISLGSPTFRLANARDLKDHKNSFHNTYLEQSPQGSDLTVPKRLQPRSQTSKARLGSKDKIAGSSQTGSPSARKTVRIKQPDSLGQFSNQLDPLYFSTFPSKKVPIRGTILPKKFGTECSPFDQGPVPPSSAYSTSPPPHQSSVQGQEDESAFSDWEIIDWPWVTPYTPAIGLNLCLSFPKLQDAFPNPIIHRHQHQNHHGIWRKKDYPSPARNKPRERRAQRILSGYLRPSDVSGDLSSPFYASKKVFEDEVRTNSYNSAYRVPARRQIETSSPSRAIEFDPAILSQGPTLSNSRLHYVSNKPVFMDMTSGAELSQKESSQKILANNILEFTKAISQMKKKDRQVVEKFLEALKSIEVEDEGNIVGIPMRQEKQKGTKINRDVLIAPASSLQRKLNPAAPAFSINIEHGGGQGEVEKVSTEPIPADHILISHISAMPVQKKAIKQNSPNVAQGPLQEKKAAERNSQSVVISGKELDGVENSRIGPLQIPVPAYERASKPARSTEKAQGSARLKGEPVWVKDLVFAAKKLKQATKRKSNAPEKPFEIWVDENALPLPSIQYPFAEVDLPLCASIDFDNLPDDEGPGRVANAMDPHWAERRLESFKEKYPLTGMVKTELGATTEIPPLLFSKKFASDIQQRLEFVLFQQKEKRALDKLIEELGSSMHSPGI